MRSRGPRNGLELLEARLQRLAYRPHRHDTYAICLTTDGVQTFDYRGTGEVSLPGQVVVLHPDERHDGRAGTEAGFGYRQLYIDPALIFEAVHMLRGRPSALPFLRAPVLRSATLARAVAAAFAGGHDELAVDSLVVQVAEGLLEADSSSPQATPPLRLDVIALHRARQFLEAEKGRVVRAAELEAVTGLTRFEVARQFRLRYGTSPYRFLLMRRLDDARDQLTRQRPLSEVALATGFADQAHFSRMFKAAFGLTPAQYRSSVVGEAQQRERRVSPR